MVLGDIVRSNARQFPDRLGIVDAQSRVRFTWAQVNARVNRLANAMLALGVRKGERVAIVSRNSGPCAEVLFAVAKIGAIVCPVNYRLHERQMAAIVDQVEPRIFFVQEPFAAVVRRLAPGLRGVEHYVDLDGSGAFPLAYERLLGEHGADEPAIDVQPDDVVAINFSSGTTGLPKGSLSTHRNRLTQCIESALFAERFEPEDIALVSAPFCAGVGGHVQLLNPAFAGAAAVMYVLDGKTWCEVVERERVSVVLTTKSRMMPVWDFLATTDRRWDVGSVTTITTAGQAHGARDLGELLQFCHARRTAKMYGLSETFATGTRLLPHEVEAGMKPGATAQERRRLESVGKPLLSMQAKVVDDAGREVPPGESGEVALKGDGVSPGYWRNPELTARCFRDGWFHTGDVGVKDEDGYLYLRGRKDFMVRTGGFWVAPVEIEDVLLSHPGIREAAVLGVADPTWGEAIKAVVCVRDGETVTPDDLRAHCQAHLARFQVPKAFEVADRLPRDEAGRVQLKELRRRFGAG